MIEIICRENQQEEQEIKLPKNIRQIGSPVGRHKIYMEDYVYTYLRSQAKADRKSAAVLFGKSCVSKDMRYTFINGAVECGQAIFQFESIYLDESFWEYIDTEGQEYFKDSSIVGWFVGEQEEGASLSDTIESAHRKYFAGRDKVLMLMDAEEEEESFYIYEQGYLQKREGYYIYYEKNIAMQEYMIRKREEQSQLEPFRQYFQWEENQEKKRKIEVIQDTEEVKSRENIEWEQLHKEIRGEAEDNRKVEEERREKGIKKEAIKEEIISQDGIRTADIREEGILKRMEKEVLGEEIKKETAKQEMTDKVGTEQEVEEQGEKETAEKIFVKSSLEEHVSEAEKALQNYRQNMLEKRGHKVERHNKRFLHTAAAFFMIAFCIVGITTINNYNKMKEVEEALHVMKGEKDTSDLIVKNVASEVTPLDSTQDQQSNSKQSEIQQAAASAQAQNQQPQVQQPTAPQQPETTQQSQVQQPAPQQPTVPQQPETQQPQTQQREVSQPETPQQPAAPQYYTVQAGDTLESICLKIYQDKSKVAALCQANGIQNGNQIQAGQKLLLP